MLEPVITSSASPTDDRRTPPQSRCFKGILLGLLLTMAALLLWQLRQEFAQQLQHQRQRRHGSEQENLPAVISRQRMQATRIALSQCQRAAPSGQKSEDRKAQHDQGEETKAHVLRPIQREEGHSGGGMKKRGRGMNRTPLSHQGITSAAPSGFRRQRQPGSRPAPGRTRGHRRPADRRGQPYRRTRRIPHIPSGRGSRRDAPS